MNGCIDVLTPPWNTFCGQQYYLFNMISFYFCMTGRYLPTVFVFLRKENTVHVVEESV